MRRLILIFICCLFVIKSKAQQDPLYTHYMYNTLSINPAYAGSREALTMTLLHRSQWWSFPGAPVTSTVTAHTPVLNDLFSLGVSYVNDQIGFVNSSSFFVDYAYRIRLNEKGKLAFGLKVGFNSLNSELSLLDLSSSGSGAGEDPAFQNIDREIKANVGFGLYYSQDNFYLGLSTPRLFEHTYQSSYREQRHFYFIAGSRHRLSDELLFEPSAFVRQISGAPISADLSTIFVYNQNVTLGAMYRTKESYGLLTGISLTEQLFVGYSFDWSASNSVGFNSKGSHEIVLRYDFIYRQNRKIRSPRYF